jgi:hypothetical protein
MIGASEVSSPLPSLATELLNTMGSTHYKGVAKLLKDLKPHKAAGPDNIRPLILKELYHEISPILCFIFQVSKKSGKIPWR